jgi:hypothetical protein
MTYLQTARRHCECFSCWLLKSYRNSYTCVSTATEVWLNEYLSQSHTHIVHLWRYSFGLIWFVVISLLGYDIQHGLTLNLTPRRPPRMSHFLEINLYLSLWSLLWLFKWCHILNTPHEVVIAVVFFLLLFLLMATY